MSTFELALLFFLTGAAVIAWYYALVVLGRESASPPVVSSDPMIPEEGSVITTHQLAEIEEKLTGLIRVIVAAHRVDEPVNGLRRAVKKNIERNVEYLFLVSKSHADSEVYGWVLMFLAIAQVVQRRAGVTVPPTNLIRISNLAFDWRDTPYVFYQSETQEHHLATIAFRGSDVDEGIAKSYTRLPASYAYSLALAILSDAPNPMTVEAPQFKVSPGISSNPAGAGDSVTSS